MRFLLLVLIKQNDFFIIYTGLTFCFAEAISISLLRGPLYVKHLYNLYTCLYVIKLYSIKR
jgi:hypothetical protein